MADAKDGNKHCVSEEGSHAVRIFDQVWPEGLSAADQALWDQLTPDLQLTVTKRLEAILAAELQLRPIAELSMEAGMDRTRFFRLRQRWNNERTLRTVIPHAHRRVRRIAPRSFSTPEGIEAAEEMVRRAIADAPTSATSRIARKVVDGLNGAISLQAAMRLVRQQRAEILRDPHILRERFGEEMRIDLSAVSLALSEGQDAGGAVVVAVVIDVASGLIVGHAAGGVHDSLVLQHRAIERAIDFLDVDRPDAIYSRTTVVLGWADQERLRSLEFFASTTPGVGKVLSSKPSRFGRGIIDIIGHRIDRLRLRPASTDPNSPKHRDVKGFSLQPMSAAHARALVDEAVANHNAPIIKLLADAGLLRPTGSAGERLVETLLGLVNGFA